MQLIGSIVAILYGVVGVTVGLAQQQSGLAPSEVDCDYRARLLRDRVVALTLRSPVHRTEDPQHDVVSNLIRETKAACSADESVLPRLEFIETRLREHLDGQTRDAEARRELLAL